MFQKSKSFLQFPSRLLCLFCTNPVKIGRTRQKRGQKSLLSAQMPRRTARSCRDPKPPVEYPPPFARWDDGRPSTPPTSQSHSSTLTPCSSNSFRNRRRASANCDRTVESDLPSTRPISAPVSPPACNSKISRSRAVSASNACTTDKVCKTASSCPHAGASSASSNGTAVGHARAVRQ